jgi:hypothetical protein
MVGLGGERSFPAYRGGGCDPATGREQRHVVTEVGEVLQLATPHAVWVVSSVDHDGASASASLLLKQQEGETQMHADKTGCTLMARSHG